MWYAPTLSSQEPSAPSISLGVLFPLQFYKGVWYAPTLSVVHSAPQAFNCQGVFPPTSFQECVVRPHSVKLGAQCSFNLSGVLFPLQFYKGVWYAPTLSVVHSAPQAFNCQGVFPPTSFQECVVRPHSVKLGAQCSFNLSGVLFPLQFHKSVWYAPTLSSQELSALSTSLGVLFPLQFYKGVWYAPTLSVDFYAPT